MLISTHSWRFQNELLPSRLHTMHVSQLFMSQSSTKFLCGLIFNLQLFMLSWQIQTPIFPCSNEAAGGGVWVLVSESFPLSQWPPKLHQNCGHGGSQGHGQGSQTQREATTSSIPCIQWEGKEYTYHTNLLIAFCKDNLDFQLKLFILQLHSRHHQTGHPGNCCKQMSANRDSYYQHITQHIFTNNQDSIVQDAY